MDAALRIALFAAVIVQVGRALLLVHRHRDVVVPVRRAVRWWMWLLAPIILTFVGASAALLLRVPGLDWGWGRLIGVDSNAWLAPVAATAESADRSARHWLAIGGALLFLAALAYVMPLFTLAEERIFRRGLERGGPVRWFKATVGFGLVHVIVGIPIGVALALSWGGMAFALVYRRARRDAAARVPVGPVGLGTPTREELSDRACIVSAAAHLAYNTELLVLLAVALVFDI